MVGYFHLPGQIVEYIPRLSFHSLFDSVRLSSGVDLFFVISGFIMTVTSRKSTPADFAMRRLIRVVPLYWLLTATLAILVLLRPELFRSTTLSVATFVKSLLFIPYPNLGQGGKYAPLLVPGWSLNFEMFFYAIFAIALFAAARRRLLICGIVFGGLAATQFLPAYAEVNTLLHFYASPRILEFWTGMLIAHFYLQDSVRFRPAVCLTMIVGGFCLLLANYSGLPLTEGSWVECILTDLIPCAAILLGTLGLEGSGRMPNWRWCSLLGDASYSIYLSHIFSLGIARLAWTRLGLAHDTALHAMLFAVISMALVIAIALLVYRLLEKPMLDTLHALYLQHRRRAPEK